MLLYTGVVSVHLYLFPFFAFSSIHFQVKITHGSTSSAGKWAFRVNITLPVWVILVSLVCCVPWLTAWGFELRSRMNTTEVCRKIFTSAMAGNAETLFRKTWCAAKNCWTELSKIALKIQNIICTKDRCKCHCFNTLFTHAWIPA